MDLFEQGLINKEIAANLNLSEFTVKNHIRRIMRQPDAEIATKPWIRASGLFPVA